MKLAKLSEAGHLRPTLVLNIILVVLILGGFGLAHTWLGMRSHDKDKEVKKIEDSIRQLENEIRRLRVQVDPMIGNGPLCNQLAQTGIELQRIDKEKIVEIGPDGAREIDAGPPPSVKN